MGYAEICHPYPANPSERIVQVGYPTMRPWPHPIQRTFWIGAFSTALEGRKLSNTKNTTLNANNATEQWVLWAPEASEILF